MAVAGGVRHGGHLLCCDVSEEWAAVARRYFARAGVADRITLKIAPALETLRALPPAADVDLAFIDADKESYQTYYEELLPRLRPNGVLVFDNVLWSGHVIDPDDHSTSTEAIRGLNDAVARDRRVAAGLLSLPHRVTPRPKPYD